MKPIGDRELGLLYARALVAIARADHAIEVEEGERLVERIASRCTIPLRVEDLLLEPPLSPEQLSEQITDRDGPFRSAQIRPHELGEALIEDGIAIMLSKGHATESEADRLWRFAEAMGVTRDEFHRLTQAYFPSEDSP